ncbi:hypothetical protein ACFQZI_02545 [Mucilaginibacter lutimaris]|uniref:DUF4328 domain-containing protein n=1 Tax=Mucilaginibacter lutimaris TaxID=931629 RepID=A0ABW2ZC22_9SPHI
MRLKLIQDFVNNNTIENLKEYNKFLIEKLKDASIQNNRVSTYMIAVVILYLFFKESTIKDVDLSFIKIEKFVIIAQLTPPLFSLLFLYYLLLNAHRAEMIQFSRILTYELYPNSLESKSSVVYREANTFARLIQPYSFWLETTKWDIDGKATTGDAILRLPVLLIVLSPLIFIIYILKILYFEYCDLTLSKYTFIFSIWVTIYTIYNLWRLLYQNYKWTQEV